jgi:hypothetical protein
VVSGFPLPLTRSTATTIITTATRRMISIQAVMPNPSQVGSGALLEIVMVADVFTVLPSRLAETSTTSVPAVWPAVNELTAPVALDRLPRSFARLHVNDTPNGQRPPVEHSATALSVTEPPVSSDGASGEIDTDEIATVEAEVIVIVAGAVLIFSTPLSVALT